jgi:isoquinoline 1-oxidoreductase beta subunit
MAAQVSRRTFLKVTALAADGFAIGLHIPGRLDAAAAERDFTPNAWIRIDADGVTIVVGQSEMGQGVLTSLPTLVAEELEIELDQVRVEQAPADSAFAGPVYGQQLTGGSTSIANGWQPLRRAGAAAREMLIAAAAERWGVEAASCRAARGVVEHPASGRSAPYSELASAAAALPVPRNVRLKEAKDFRLIGKPLKRVDTPAKVNGSAEFSMDVRVPGMLVAMLRRCPVHGGTMRSFAPDAALAIAGVRHVLPIESGIAVVASDTWSAKRGVDALDVEWDEGPNAEVGSAEIEARFAAAAELGPALVAEQAGDIEAAFGAAARTVEAVYQVPFLAHAPMEPMSCTADVRADSCELWVPTQAQTLTQRVAAKIGGLAPSKVRVHTTLIGGSFGRRLEIDFVTEAVQLSRALGLPIKVVWSREDDIAHGTFRPCIYSRLTAALDSAGDPIAWTHRVVAPSILKRYAPFVVFGGAMDFTSVDGAVGRAYAIPNRRVDYVEVGTPLRAGFWRSVGNSHTAFAMEAFADELAAARAGWGEALPPGRHRGIAFHESMGAIVAEVAEISVAPGEQLRVHRVVCAIDCGTVVNPDTVVAQVEGSIVFGLTAALFGQITLQDGRVQQSNFHDYPMLRMHQMPDIDVHIVASTEHPGGVGEPATPPIAPALINAYYAATGKRIRRLPLYPENRWQA